MGRPMVNLRVRQLIQKRLGASVGVAVDRRYADTLSCLAAITGVGLQGAAPRSYRGGAFRRYGSLAESGEGRG